MISPPVNICGDSGIRGMLTGQPDIIGVTFQRPTAPPPIVSGTTTQPLGPWKFILEMNISILRRPVVSYNAGNVIYL